MTNRIPLTSRRALTLLAAACALPLLVVSATADDVSNDTVDGRPPHTGRATPQNPIGKADKTGDNSEWSADGGEGSYKDCVSNWDKSLHMTKEHWRGVCRRTHPRG